MILFLLISTVSCQLWPPGVPNLQNTDLTIQRYWNGIRMFHSYLVTNSTYPILPQAGSIREEDVGRVISATNEGRLASQCSTPLVSITRYERNTQSATLPNQMTQFGYPSAAFGQIGLLYPTMNQAGYLNPVSYFGTTAPSGDWTARENFFCSPNIGNCGANFPLTMYPTMDGTTQTATDLFYPSNPSQIATMNAGLMNWSRNGSIVCYIWK